ncbi:MAG: hypothetical protein QOK38_3622 [Acidobacteriaceae bacterium]|nr:hypothetical protein [Acidobacteriaceae bacterium]
MNLCPATDVFAAGCDTFVGNKNSTQMSVAEDDYVIEAFSTDRADQPLRMPVLPRRLWCRRLISDAHGRKPPGDSAAIGRVAVADEVFRRRHAERYLAAALAPENDQSEEQLKADRRHEQEVHAAIPAA